MALCKCNLLTYLVQLAMYAMGEHLEESLIILDSIETSVHDSGTSKRVADWQ